MSRAEQSLRGLVFRHQFFNLGTQHLNIDTCGWRLRFRASSRNAGWVFKRLALASIDPLGIDLDLPRQFHQRLGAPDGGRRELCMECRGMFRHPGQTRAEIPLCPGPDLASGLQTH